MSKETRAMHARIRGTDKTHQPSPFQVKPVKAAQVAAVILDELSRAYGDVCNFLEAVKLLNEDQVFLAYVSVQERVAAIADSSARHVWVKAQAVAALKKLVAEEYDRWPDTRRAWFRTEHRCLRLNQKFAVIRARLSQGKLPTRSQSVNLSLKRFYEALLYALSDTFPMGEVCEEAYYGPGSSVSIRGREVHYVRKVQAYECPSTAREMAVEALMYDKVAWQHLGMDPIYSTNEDAQAGFRRLMRERLSEGGEPVDRLMFIHKSMTSHRSIGAQPTCSGMLQLGVHNVGSRILRNLGITLDNQSRNQKAAYEGSRDWREDNPLCTLDKSNASNLLALGLIQTLFPPAWGKALCRLRTTHYQAPDELGGGVHPYHMYAGMGNGTTFFVETLVFWAIAYATSDWKDVRSFVDSKSYFVYGDDVVLRRDHALRYMALAKYLGFTFNKEKTFLYGPFRESCGADYFDGINVRPGYPSSNAGSQHMSDLDLIGIHNTLADQRSFPLDGACARIRKIWKHNVYPVLPTDTQGNLGFRPVGCDVYDLVRDRSNRVTYSEWWQRPRCFTMQIRSASSDLRLLDPWTQMAVSLLKARQSWKEEGWWEISVRDVVHTKVVPERDMEKKELITMLRNSLQRLATWKQSAWWKPSRGL